MKLSFLILLSVLVFADTLSTWPFAISQAFASALSSPDPATTNVQNFLKQGQVDHSYHGPLLRSSYNTDLLPPAADLKQPVAKILPSVQPAKMQPIRQSLVVSSSRAQSKALSALSLLSSDKSLEVQLVQGKADLSQAHVSGVAQTLTSGTPMTLQVLQVSGHTVGTVSVLGTYELSVLDGQNHTLQGVNWHGSVKLVYHYQPAELAAFGLDPARIVMSWPASGTTKGQANSPTSSSAVLMQNNAKAHTLTATVPDQSIGTVMLSGTSQAQNPEPPHTNSVNGNSGNFTYNVPLALPPGPNGLLPQVGFNYSSADPNSRHSLLSPAGSLGDGWTPGLGSITMQTYGSSSGTYSQGNWFFLSGADNVSDRLVADPNNVGSFYTEHISYLRVRGSNMSSTTSIPGCFTLWDTSGTYYEYGCTSDSLQYWTDSLGQQHPYRWDLDRIVRAHEGPGTNDEHINISYFQDKVTTSGQTSVRDAVVAQVTYGTYNVSANTSSVTGSIDYHYRAPSIPATVPSGTSASWVQAYGNNYNCSGSPPAQTTLRCDDPIDEGAALAPTVMSTFSLQQIISYVGPDTNNKPAYRYDLAYTDTPFVQTTDPISGTQEYGNGEHLLTSITPTIYQSGTAFARKPFTFSYTAATNTYYDSTQNGAGSQPVSISIASQYLSQYVDGNTNIGDTVTYNTAYSNTRGTPYATDASGNPDDRHDPFYCTVHANDSDIAKRCTGNYAHPDDHTWTVQVVTQIVNRGTDSSAITQGAVTKYSYLLAAYNTYQQNYNGTGVFCSPARNAPQGTLGQNDCVYDTYIPGNFGQDQDWQDFYHGEFRGFGQVYITSPASNLTVDSYYAPEAWGTQESNSRNYQSSHLKKEDIYTGNQVADSALLQETVNQYTGNAEFLSQGSQNYSNSCTLLFNTNYPPCEPTIVFSKTTWYEGTGTSNTQAPWVQTTYAYDDYDTTNGLKAGYHNITQAQTTSSNAPTLTKKWTYAINNSVDPHNSAWIYYQVHTVSHSEVDDSTGHVWQCQNTAYDEGVASGVPSPSAGWPTTQTTYSNCANQSGTALKSYTGYDSYGHVVATVDSFGSANSSLYSRQGCTPATAPAYHSAAWTATRYTSCSAYDSYQAQTTSQQNVLGQQSSTTYNYNQAASPTSMTDANNQQTNTNYSYDNAGNSTKNVSQPGESGSYTTQSNVNTNCTASSTTPCYEMDSNSSVYSDAVTRTFSDSQGRAVETRTPLDATHDTIVFTVYNDAQNSVFKSVSFRAPSGTSWVDPNFARDENNTAPGGTVTFSDALGRTIAVLQPVGGGLTCGTLSGTYNTCTTYGLGSANGDSSIYHYAKTLDANNHMTVSLTDALGRERYSQLYSTAGSINSNITTKQETQYNVLDKPTAVIVTDLAPQTNLAVTSATTTTSYNDLGQLTNLSDPDRGTHTYSYDADGRQITDVSGTRTIGTSYDLAGRVGCVQDAAPTTNGSGSCSSGSHPLVQDTYDVSKLGASGTTDFPIGQLTQSVSTTYYPDGTSSATTEQLQHDQRGRMITDRLQIMVPDSWSTTLPTYQETQNYNDANQSMTTQTTVGGNTGYTFSQSYDGTTGMLVGLSNTSVGNTSLVSQSYDLHGQVMGLNFPSSTGSQLVNNHFNYDGDLRPAATTATWNATNTNFFNKSLVYDAVGNVVSANTSEAAVSGQSNSGGGESENFCYDEANHLVWAGNGGTEPGAGNGTCGSAGNWNSISGADYSSSYTYTHLGQIWQGPLNNSGSTQQYLACNSAHPHQLTGVYPAGTTCATLSGATASYSASYDSWGNETSRTYNGTTATLSYNALDELVQWNAGSTNQAWYAYNASGQRTVARSITSSGTSLTVYAFGLEEHVYNSSGSNTANTYYYTLGGRLIGKFDGTTTQYYLTDAQGSVLLTFSNVVSTTNVLGNQAYGPYGKQLASSGTMGTSKGYTGQYNDPTGLDYYNARYYDPVVGLFVSVDTVQGNLLGFNPSAYVSSNPETGTDPTGHCWPLCAIVAGAIIGLVAVEVSGLMAGHQPSASELFWGAAGGAVAATVGVIALTLIAGVAGTTALGATGVWAAGASSAFIASTTWGGAIGAGVIGGTVAGVAAGITGSMHNWWTNNIDAPPHAVAPGVTPTPININVQPQPTPTSYPDIQTPSSNTSSGWSAYSGQSGWSAYSGQSGWSAYSGQSGYTVASGDTLWGIATRFLGSGYQWQRIYQANRGVIGGNPDLIYPGERLAIPH